MIAPGGLLAALLVLLPAARAYTCDLYPADTCTADGTVTVATSGTTAVATARLGPRDERMDVFARVCAPADWTLHLADSPTNVGDGYDDGTSDHDAEAELYDGGVFRMTSTGGSRGAPVFQVISWADTLGPDSADAAGCHTVRLAFVDAPLLRTHATVEYDPDAADGAGVDSVLSLLSFHGPRLYYVACATAAASQRGSECEYEDSTFADMGKWYIGVNRTVGDATRTGTGVEEACVVLSEDRTTVPASCL